MLRGSSQICVESLVKGMARKRSPSLKCLLQAGLCLRVFFLLLLLLELHLFLPSPSDRITSPLVTLDARTHAHTLLSLLYKLFSRNPSLPLTQTSSCWTFSLHPVDPPSLYFSVSSTNATVTHLNNNSHQPSSLFPSPPFLSYLPP